MLTPLSGVAHNSVLRVSKARIFIPDTNRPDRQRSGVTSHSHYNRKTPPPDFSLRL